MSKEDSNKRLKEQTIRLLNKRLKKEPKISLKRDLPLTTLRWLWSIPNARRPKLLEYLDRLEMIPSTPL
jgi:hypothetical protein